MKLNSTEQKTCKEHIYKGKQDNNEKETRMCYECDKSNHFIKNYCSKMQQQLNVITKCDKFKDYDQVEELDVKTP